MADVAMPKVTAGCIKSLADSYDVEEAYMRKHLKLAILPPAEIERALSGAGASAQELFGE